MADIGGINSYTHVSDTQQNSSDQNNSGSSVYQTAPLADLTTKALQGDQQSLDALAALIYALQNTLTQGEKRQGTNSSQSVNVNIEAANDPLIYRSTTINDNTQNSDALGDANSIGGSIRATTRDLNAPQMRMLSANNQFANGAAANGSGSGDTGLGGIGGIGTRPQSAGNNFQSNGNQLSFETDSVFRRSDDIFDQVAELLKEQQRIGEQSAQLTASSGAIATALQALQTVSRNIRA